MDGERLFILHGINGSSLDITERITVPTYKVASHNIYETWEDSNYTTHKYKVARKFKGTFTLKFFTQEEFIEFDDFVENNLTDDNYINATVYCNKRHVTEKIRVFLDYDAENTLPFIGMKDYEGFEVTIQER